MLGNKLDYLKLHVSVLLAGFTGMFAKLISLNEVLIVWYRVILALFLFGGYLFVRGKIPVVRKSEAFKIAALGVLLAIHLVFFFASIKYSNVSIGVVCYSLVGFFTVLFEPLIMKSRFSFWELIYSLVAVLGIFLIFSFDTSFRLGIILGVISAALFALYTLYNKLVEKGKSTSCMLYYELIGGAVFMSLFLPVYLILNPTLTFIPTPVEMLWLVVLAFFCTVVLYLLHIGVLKTLSAFTVSLTGNLEPVYGILFAILFFKEAQELAFSFYAGMCLIFMSVFLQSFIKKPAYKKVTR